MLPTTADLSVYRPWIICEPGQRWLTAVRRFAPEQMPKPLAAVVMPGDPSTALTMLAGQQSAVILWSTDRENLRDTCDRLVQTALAAPSVLQLVADQGLSPRGRLLMLEFPVHAIIGSPEQLPRLTPMIQGYFARTSEYLDY